MSVMKQFDPISSIENSALILDGGEWPSFHDAEIHELKLWRGDVRPEDDVWIGPLLEMTFELCALKDPYIVVLAFHDCEVIDFSDFKHQNGIFDMTFAFEERGFLRNGEPMTPYIAVTMAQSADTSLSLKCFRIEAKARRER